MKKFSEYTEVIFRDLNRKRNVNFNFLIVDSLCRIPQKANLNKPAILIIAAIVECLFYEFIRYVNEHEGKKMPGLDEEAVTVIRDINTDKFRDLVRHMKTINFYKEVVGSQLYDELELLRNMRNRIHIQNDYEVLDDEEELIWTETNLCLAGNVLKKTCKILCQVYLVKGGKMLSFKEFPEPWSGRKSSITSWLKTGWSFTRL